MLPIKHSTIFKSRWVALLWAAGICWLTWDFAHQVKTPEGNQVDDPNDFISPFFTTYQQPFPRVKKDAFEFRSSSVARQKPPDEIRILCLGGSTTVNFRAGISYTDVLEQRFAESADDGWHVRPTHLVGIYTWADPGNGVTFVRFAYAARAESHDAARPLDEGIVRALWLTYEELAARGAEHRSPLVLQCVEDYRAGQKWPPAVIKEL